MNARFAFLGAVVCAAALAACGGGGGGGGSVVPTSPSTPGTTPAPPAASPSPNTLQTSAPLSVSTTTPVQFAALNNGVAASVTFPLVSTAATASFTYSSVLPQGIAYPQQARSSRLPAIIGGSNITPLAYLAVQTSATTTLTALPAFTFTLPGVPLGSAYIAYYDESTPTKGWNVLAGPGSETTTTISFPAQSVIPPLTLQTGDTYLFALVISSTSVTQAPTTFQGTKSVNYTYGFAFDYPQPTSTAPPTTLNYAVTENVSVGSSPFPGTANVSTMDEHVAETDTQDLSNATYATDQWVGVSPNSGSVDAALYASQQSETSSANMPTFTTLYSTPQVLDEYPETVGASWTNSPAAKTSYSYANGDSGTRTTNADGTYNDVETLLGFAPVTISDNADGSASIVGPFFSGQVASLTFSAPSPGPSGSVVNIAINFPPASPQPAPITFSDQLWYPTPPAFYQEKDGVLAAASFPTGCTNALGTSGNDVQRSVTTLDTAIGFMETTTFDTYTVGGVPVCMVTNDTLSYAYDMQGNTPFFILYGPLGVETVTTTETLALQASAGTTTAAMTRAHAGGSSSYAPVIAAIQAHQLNTFARTRLSREHTVMQQLRAHGISALKAFEGGHR